MTPHSRWNPSLVQGRTYREESSRIQRNPGIVVPSSSSNRPSCSLTCPVCSTDTRSEVITSTVRTWPCVNFFALGMLSKKQHYNPKYVTRLSHSRQKLYIMLKPTINHLWLTLVVFRNYWYGHLICIMISARVSVYTSIYRCETKLLFDNYIIIHDLSPYSWVIR